MKRILQIIAILFLTVVFLLLFFVLTSPGLRIGFYIAQNFIPGKIKIETINGSLIDHFTLQNVTYKNKKQIYKFKNIDLSWRPIDLLHGQIHISALKFVRESLKGTIVGNISTHKDHQMKIDGEFVYTHQNFETIFSSLNLKGNLNDKLNFVFQTKSPFNSEIKGEIDNLYAKGAIKISGNWRNVFIPIGKNTHINSTEGTLNVSGTLTNYLMQLKADIGGTAMPEGDWNISAKGNLDSLNLAKISGKILNGTVDGSAKISWQKDFIWNINLKANKVNPGLRWHDWNGELSFDFNSSRSIANGKTKINFLLANLRGTLHGFATSGQVDAELDDGIWAINNSYFHVGDDVVKLRANLAENWNINWIIHAPKLEEILPSSIGNLDSNGTVTGERSAPNVKAFFKAHNVFYEDFSAQDLAGNINFVLKPKGPTDITFSAANLKYAEYKFKSIALNSKGTIDNHLISGYFAIKKANFYLSLLGQHTKNGWVGTLKRFDMNSTSYKNWHLEKPVVIKLNPNSQSVSPFCWLENKSASICGNFSRDKNGWKIELKSQKFPLALLEDLYPAKIKINANTDLDIKLSQLKNSPIEGHIVADATNGELLYFDPEIEITQPIKFTSAHYDSYFAKKLTSHFVVKTKASEPINIELNLPDYKKDYSDFTKQKITGHININILSLNQLPVLIPGISDADGKISADLKLAGTLFKPLLNGQAKLFLAKTKILQYGTKISAGNLDLNFNNNKITINGNIHIGDGILSLAGNTQIDNYFATKLKLSGGNLDGVDTDELKTTINPDINLDFDYPKLTISGTVNVPKGLYAPEKYEKVVRLPSNVLVSKGAENIAVRDWLKVFVNVNLILGKDIQLDIKGLKGNVTGNLALDLKPKQATTATGQLSVVNGTYVAYGVKLNIERGRLIFTGGPLSNPGLDIKATKASSNVEMPPPGGDRSETLQRPDIASLPQQTNQNNSSVGVQKFKVGVIVSGTQDDPIITLFSDPGGLSNADILSYIILGMPSQNASLAQGQSLFQAANAMGMGESSVTDELSGKYGFSEFGLETSMVTDTSKKITTPEQNTSFVIGKYISPKLYMHYSMGLLIPINILNLRYVINRRLSLQADTSTIGNGADLFYTFQTETFLHFGRQ